MSEMQKPESKTTDNVIPNDYLKQKLTQTVHETFQQGFITQVSYALTFSKAKTCCPKRFLAIWAEEM